MKALRWHGRRDVRMEEVPDAPFPGPLQVRIAVEWCGICGTDLEEYTKGPLFIPTSPHPLTGVQAPVVIGHEVVGRIIDVGSEVQALHPGQLAAVDGILSCGKCRACQRHAPMHCPLAASIGMSYPGGLAELLTVPSYMVIAAPDNVSPESLALAEPFSVAVRAVRKSSLQVGDHLAIFGAGPIGLAVTQVAHAAGADRVAVVDPVPDRRQMAAVLGASAVLDPERDDVVEELKRETGWGPDIVFDCTGSNRIPELATRVVRAGGKVVLVGLPPEPGRFDFLQLVAREVQLLGSVAHVYDEDFRTAVDLIVSGRVDARAMITSRIPLDRAVPDGIEALARPDHGKSLKILVTPGKL